MEIVPSKELMSKILGEKIDFVGFEDKNTIYYGVELCWKRTINIYEFAHKCKEWALSKGYTIISESEQRPEGYNGYEYVFRRKNDSDLTIYTVGTECEAIFKACEWILQNKAS